MIRFIDLTGEYWTHPDCSSPICAFLSTSDDRFYMNQDGSCTFSSMEDITELGDHDFVKRMVALVPEGFFERENPLEGDQAETFIQYIDDRIGDQLDESLQFGQDARRFLTDACNLLRRRYT
ncbi:MAG: hypothetical protein ACYS7Y_04435 [Planctomycetota bacterium]|jgi:hypothetical protein